MSQVDLIRASKPFIDIISTLDIDYYVGGSVASSAHGLPRTTIDVDIVADIKHEHVASIVAALQDAYYIDAQMIHNAIDSHASFNLIHLDTFIKLDVFILKPTPYDLVAIKRTVGGQLSSPSAPFPIKLSSPEDVILHKLYWFRLGGEQSTRQWGDLLGVIKVQSHTLDYAYLRQWAFDLQVSELLKRALSEANIA